MKIGPQQSSISEPDRYRLLIADGNVSRRKMMRDYLEKSGHYEITEAWDGLEALNFLQKEPFHLVIADEKVPKMDGLELLKLIRRRYDDLPVVITAAYGGDTGSETLELGADDCIYLPLHLEEFKFRIERALRFHHLIKTRENLERENKELWGRAITDRLTGLYNRQYFEEIYTSEFERTKRYRSQLGCLLLDIDHFKKVNDDYGHLIGDTVLHEIGKLIMNTIRRVDIAARYGGEEFVVLMPETTREGLSQVGERVRVMIEQFEFCRNHPSLSTPMRQVTVSLGAVHYPDEEIKDSLTMLRIADENLYRAKRNGRNRQELAWENVEDSDSK